MAQQTIERIREVECQPDGTTIAREIWRAAYESGRQGAELAAHDNPALYQDEHGAWFWSDGTPAAWYPVAGWVIDQSRMPEQFWWSGG